MRISALLVIMLVFWAFLASCGRQETPVGKAEEEVSAEETAIEATNNRADATIEETTSMAEVDSSEATPEPTGEAVNSQEEERINAPPEEATRERNQAQTEEGISVTQTATPGPAVVGHPLTFSIVVTNNSIPQHVGVNDFLPPGMAPVSATSSQGTCGISHHESNDVVCTLGVVQNGGSVTVEVVAIPRVPGTMTNIVNAGGNSAPVKSVPMTVTVNPAPASGTTEAHGGH